MIQQTSNFIFNQRRMLSRMKIFKNLMINCRIGYAFNDSNLASKDQAMKFIALTKEHIDQSKNIKQLLGNIKYNNLSKNPLFSPLMNKITLLLNRQKSLSEEQLLYIELLTFEMRRFCSIQTDFNASSLANFQLFFKQISEIFKQRYSNTGLENRATIAVESLLQSASFENWEPITISLIHYMSTLSKISKSNFKKNILSYFSRLDSSRVLPGEKRVQLSNSQSNQNSLPNSQHDFLIDFIILSCSQFRESKTSIQYTLDTLAIKTISTKIYDIFLFLDAHNLLDLYYRQFRKKMNFQLKSSESQQIRNALGKNSNLTQYYKNTQAQTSLKVQQKIIINNEVNFLHIVDVYINLLNKSKIDLVNYVNLQVPVQMFSSYFYMVLLISQNMKIYVSTKFPNRQNNMQFRQQMNKLFEMQKLHNQQNQKNSAKIKTNKEKISPTNEQRQIKQIKLWKILVQITKQFSMNKTYAADKQKILELALYKTIGCFREYLTQKISSNSNQDDEKQQIETKQSRKQKKIIYSQLKSQIQGYEDHIIKFIAYLPIQVLKKYQKLQPNVILFLSQIVKVCTKIAIDSANIEPVITNLLQLARFKNSLIISKKQWVQIFKNIIKRDKNFEFWNVYFFLASTNDKKLTKLIPLKQIGLRIREQRAKLEQKKLYKQFYRQEIIEQKIAKPEKVENVTNNADNIQINSRKMLQQLGKEQEIKHQQSRKWQVRLLQFHALVLLHEQSIQLVQLLKQINDSEINGDKKIKLKVEQIEQQLYQWITPFDYNLITHLQYNYQKKMNDYSMDITLKNKDKIKLDESTRSKFYLFKPIPYFRRYFDAIFIQTGVYYQLRLINKLLSHPIIQNNLLHWRILSNQNFIWYFMVVLYGLADTKNKAHYMQKYSIDKIFDKDVRSSIIFKNNISDLTRHFFLVQQEQMFYSYLQMLKIISSYKDQFSDIIYLQQMYKNVAVENPITKLKPKTKKVRERKKSTQQQSAQEQYKNQLFSKFAIVNLLDQHDLQTLPKVGKYSKQEYIKIIKLRIKLLIDDSLNSTNFKSSNNYRLVAIGTFLTQISYLNPVSSFSTLGQNLEPFLSPEDKQHIKKLIISSYDGYQNPMLSYIFYLFNNLNLITSQMAMRIVKTFRPSQQFSILRIECYNLIGRQNLFKHGLLTQRQYANLQLKLFRNSKRSIHSFQYILNSLKFGGPSRVTILENLISRIINPIQRKIYIRQFKKFLQKYKLVNQKFYQLSEQKIFCSNNQQNVYENIVDQNRSKRKGSYSQEKIQNTQSNTGKQNNLSPKSKYSSSFKLFRKQ